MYTEPHVHVGAPLQRDGDSFLVDVPFTGFYELGYKCDLASVEYSLTGDFAGEEKTCTPKISDEDHYGTTQLEFSPTGTPYNFVWDALTDLGNGEISDVAQIRIKAVFGSNLGEYGTSSQFLIDTRVVVTTGGASFIRGEIANLKIVFTDPDGLMIDPSSVQMVSIIDPSGEEQLYSPIEAVQVYTGEWDVDWEVPTDAELGRWAATWAYELDYEVESHVVDFNIEARASIFEPIGQDTCVVHGRILYADETPIADADVMFIPHHLSDPELGNPTRIGVEPIEATTDSKGRFVVELIKDTEVIIFVPALNFRQFAKVPDQPTAEFRTMMTTLPVGDRDKFGNRTS